MRAAVQKRIAVNIAVVFFILIFSNSAIDIRNWTYDFLVGVLKTKLLYDTCSYSTYETDNFIISFPKDEYDTALMIGDITEKDYKVLRSSMNYVLNKKVHIIIYSDLELMRSKLHLSAQDTPMGVYFGGILHILSPSIWIHEYDIADVRRVFTDDGPMLHELTHLAVDKITHGNYPMWLTEGLALYYEYHYIGYEWGKDTVYEYSPYTLHDLTYNFDSLDKYLAYRKCFEIIRQIANEYGEKELLHIVNQLGNGGFGVNSQVLLEREVYNLIK